jgi:hypothetical protein
MLAALTGHSHALAAARVSSGPPLSARPRLRLVDGTPEEWGWFCGHCAAPPADGEAPRPTARVCPSCGLGLLLETCRGSIPTPHESFLVVDSSLLVQAMSRRAEYLLRMREDSAVNRPVTDLLSPAAAETTGRDDLGAAIVAAADHGGRPGYVNVRPWNTFGVRMRARVSPCGPRRAALLVLDAARVSSLRSADD